MAVHHVDDGEAGRIFPGPSTQLNREVADRFLRRCRWKGRSQNLVHKLVQRQLLVRCPAQAYHQRRSLYHCIVPNYTEQGVQTPPGFLRKFSPDGKILLAFSNDQRDVVVYEYLGAGAAQSLYESGEEEEEGVDVGDLFGKFFKVRCTIPVAENGEHLNRECSIFTEDCQYAIVVSSEVIRDDYPNMLDMLRNNESIASSSLSILEDYTVYLVDLIGGSVTDSATFKCDKINLSHNQGLSLCNSHLAILSIQQQTIHLFEVANGVLTHLQDIGRFCYPETSVTLPDLSVIQPVSLLPTNAISEKWFTTLKHRLVCYLLRQAEEQSTPANRSPLVNYFNKYAAYKALRISKMQLLGEGQLLLKYANEETITQKPSDSSPQTCLYVFYDIETTEILSVQENISERFLKLYERHVDSFRYPVAHPLCRDTSSLANNPHCKALHEKFKETIKCAKYGGSMEATRRLLGQLPVCSQSFSNSPYLDLALFYYDDKWISALERPKPCGDNPIKLANLFVAIVNYSIALCNNCDNFFLKSIFQQIFPLL